MRRQVSTIFATFFLIVTFLGCSVQQSPLRDHLEMLPGIFLTKQYVEEYGKVESKELDAYIEIIKERLGLSNVKSTVIVLATAKPIAFTPGGEFVLISEGLLKLLDSEAEFSFVLSHELGHIILSHHEKSRTISDDSDKKNLEFDADLFALNILNKAGYDPRAAPQAVRNAHNFDGDLVCYGDAKERARRLSAKIEGSRDGVLNIRAYKRIISFLP